MQKLIGKALSYLKARPQVEYASMFVCAGVIIGNCIPQWGAIVIVAAVVAANFAIAFYRP